MEEQNHQVGIMDDIHSLKIAVYAWLGTFCLEYRFGLEILRPVLELDIFSRMEETGNRSETACYLKRRRGPSQVCRGDMLVPESFSAVK